MKRMIPLMVALALLFCFAMPAIASPPEGLFMISVVDQFVSNSTGYVAQEAAPIVGVAPEPLPAAQATYSDSIADSSLAYGLYTLLLVGMLAGTMRAAHSASKRLISDRGIANGFAGGRRWV